MSETTATTRRVVWRVVEEMNQDLGAPVDLGAGDRAALYTPDGPLTSLDLVALVVAVEQELADELGVTITIVDDRAMALKHNPFATVGSFVEYVSTLLEQDGG